MKAGILARREKDTCAEMLSLFFQQQQQQQQQQHVNNNFIIANWP